MVRDITWRSQQIKNVHFLELSPFGKKQNTWTSIAMGSIADHAEISYQG